MICVLYTDDSILAGPNKARLQATIKAKQKQLTLTVVGDLEDFLSVNIERKKNGT